MSQSLTRFAGPAVVAIAALVMLGWSWGTWPDPLVDFGVQLYVPWQLALGRLLYRDIAYYNGPLSVYLSAGAFLIAGVSLRTIVWLNLILLAFTFVLAYRLTARAASKGVAILGGLTFALVFAFGQTVLIGNYNWVTPYHSESTQGTLLGLAAIAAVARYQRRGGFLWIAGAGLLLGAALLTKTEPSAASMAAVAIQLASEWWIRRASVQKILGDFWPLVIFLLLLPLIAFASFACFMPMHTALRGVLGSWPWAFDRRITSLVFYQNVTGLNDIAGNLAIILRWSAGYGIFLGLFTIIALSIKPRLGKITCILTFALTLIGLIFWFNQISWTGMITPLPLCLSVAFAVTAIRIIRRNTEFHAASLRIALIVFACCLLAKMGLKPHVYHYGFVLAWPGTIVLLAMVGWDLPHSIDHRGGSGNVVRAAAVAAWLVAVFAVLHRDAINFDDKHFIVASNTPDAFAANSCGQEVQAVCDEINRLIPANGTVAVFPQGLMINYLTRRANPSRFDNFMPPEVIAEGERFYLAELEKHPPDLVVLTSSVVESGQFTLDGRDDYGRDTLAWIKQHYQPVAVINLPKPLPTIYRFVVSKRKEL